MKREYYRHLPHQIPEGVPVFVTWNLKGAMPKAVIQQLQGRRETLYREPRRADETTQQRLLRQSKTLFGESDQFLDSRDTGPLLLREASAAQIVEDAILDGSDGKFTL